MMIDLSRIVYEVSVDTDAIQDDLKEAVFDWVKRYKFPDDVNRDLTQMIDDWTENYQPTGRVASVNQR